MTKSGRDGGKVTEKYTKKTRLKARSIKGAWKVVLGHPLELVSAIRLRI